jgi:hypothetical protein
MQLIYSIPDKLYYIKDFLSHDMYKGIHNAIIKERKKINLHTTKGIWSEDLINNIVPPLRTEVGNYKPFEQLKVLVKHNAFFQLKNIEKISTTIHCMKKDSGINWHDDGKNWKYGATYYLNNRWNENWGGEFMFSSEKDHGWIPPVGNCLVIIKAPFKHKVNPVLSPILPRISVQMFIR